MKNLIRAIAVVLSLTFSLVGSSGCQTGRHVDYVDTFPRSQQSHPTEGYPTWHPLRGFDRMRVQIPRIDPEIEELGVKADLLKAVAEDKLRSVGITILSEDEWLKESNCCPLLWAAVSAYDIPHADKNLLADPMLGYTLYLEFNLTAPYRKSWQGAGGYKGWPWKISSGFLAVSSLHIITHFNALVDEFVKSWQYANPKK